MEFFDNLSGSTKSTIGDLIGSELQYRRDKKTAARQMHFQERMSNTAYQRAMADMRKAGINPIMVTKLGGASTPTGAGFKSADLGKLGTNAIQSLATAKQIQLTDANINKVKATTAKEQALTKEINQKTSSGYWNAVTNNLSQQDRKLSVEITDIMARTSGTKLANTIKKWEYNYFRGRGYPSQVLITTMENGLKTDLYHGMNKTEKAQYFKTVYSALNKIMSNADEVVKDPAQYINNNFSPLVASALTLILGGIFKRSFNKKTIQHKHQNRKRYRHGNR